jgi:hypothetical protein
MSVTRPEVSEVLTFFLRIWWVPTGSPTAACGTRLGIFYLEAHRGNAEA